MDRQREISGRRALRRAGLVLMGLLLGGLATSRAVRAQDLVVEQWSPGASMAIGRYGPAIATLSTGPNAGRVLVAGGYANGRTTKHAEIYDPASDTWTQTGSLIYSRNLPSVTEFGDGSGRLLIAGGCTNEGRGDATIRTTEIYNPTTGTFSITRDSRGRQTMMAGTRELHVAVRLPTGKILLAGGMSAGWYTLRTAELYDPVAGTFKATGSMVTSWGRSGADALLLPASLVGGQGKVLFVGGKEHNTNTNRWNSLNSVELYDIGTGKFTLLANRMKFPRDVPKIAWVPNVGPFVTGSTTQRRGLVLIVGGKWEGGTTPDVVQTEWFDPVAATFSDGPSLQEGHMAHTLTPLGDGSLLAAGGWCEALMRSTEGAERFVPSSGGPPWGFFSSFTTMQYHGHDAGAVTLPPVTTSVTNSDGSVTTSRSYRVLVVGGKYIDYNTDPDTVNYPPRAEIYSHTTSSTTPPPDPAPSP